MSRHWKPEIVTRDWTRPNAYRRGGGATVVVLLLTGAVAAGLGAAYLMQPRVDDSAGRPDAPIEWNAVQAVPTRTLTPDEIEWEKHGREAAPTSGELAANGPTSATTEEASYTRLYVVDGDTFGLGRERIRILGMDAQETHPARCAREAELGNAATERLRSLLTSGTLTISGTGHDRYGRELRTVRVNGQDVREVMIGAGLARRYAGEKRGGWC